MQMSHPASSSFFLAFSCPSVTPVASEPFDLFLRGMLGDARGCRATILSNHPGGARLGAPFGRLKGLQAGQTLDDLGASCQDMVTMVHVAAERRF